MSQVRLQIIDATRKNDLSYTTATLNDFPYKALYKTTSHISHQLLASDLEIFPHLLR